MRRDDEVTPVKAWRTYLGLTQTEVATRIGISQPSYTELENSRKPRKASREKIAAALGITAEQLNF